MPAPETAEKHRLNHPCEAIAAAWVFTRVAMAVFVARIGPGDVVYYFRQLRDHNAAEALREYPGLLVVPLRVIFWLSREHFTFFVVGVAVLMLIVDGALTWYLARQRNLWGVAAWLACGLALAPVVLGRLDLMAGATVAAAAACFGRYPKVAAILVGVAGALKLWPLALIVGLCGVSWKRSAILAGIAVGTFAAINLIIGVLCGMGRALSPLTYQADRGLQSEAIAATPLWWSRLADPQQWRIFYAASKSYEISGPGSGALLTATTVGVLLAGLGLIALAVWLIVSPRAPRGAAAIRALWLAIIVVVIATSKVFSPQFMLWLCPLVCVIVALDWAPARRDLAWLGGCAVVAAVATTLVYPVYFQDFISGDNPSAWVYACATARNLLLLVIGGLGFWAFSRRSDRARA